MTIGIDIAADNQAAAGIYAAELAETFGCRVDRYNGLTPNGDYDYVIDGDPDNIAELIKAHDNGWSPKRR